MIWIYKFLSYFEIVFFKGVLTEEEFSKLVPQKINKDDYFSLEVDLFKGGINRFFTFIPK